MQPPPYIPLESLDRLKMHYLGQKQASKSECERLTKESQLRMAEMQVWQEAIDKVDREIERYKAANPEVKLEVAKMHYQP